MPVSPTAGKAARKGGAGDTGSCTITITDKGNIFLLKRVASLVLDSASKTPDSFEASKLVPLDSALTRLCSAATDGSKAALSSLPAVVKVAASGWLNTKSSTLTLQQASPVTTWFTNRPSRSAGSTSTCQFLNEIYGVESNPLNAAITYTAAGSPGPAADQVFNLQLYDGQYDVTTNQLTYSWKPLAGSSVIPAGTAGGGTSEAEVKGTAASGGRYPYGPAARRSIALSSPSIFLDDCPGNVPFFCCTGSGCNNANNEIVCEDGCYGYDNRYVTLWGNPALCFICVGNTQSKPTY
eukprot:gene13402-13530_t